MKLTRSLVGLAIIFSIASVSFLSLPARATAAGDTTIALQRGYRTGYSDGYMAGYRDSIDSLTKNYERHSEYAKADRAFNKEYGNVEEYRNGYQQGFESGYDAGFAKQSFEAAIPPNLTLRSTASVDMPAEPPTPAPAIETPPAAAVPVAEQTQPAAPVVELPVETAAPAQTYSENAAAATPVYATNDDPITLPRDTELILELQDELSTDTTKEGDKFTARVVSPAEVSGAMIEGRVEKVQRPGRIKRRSQILLSFDRIVLTENRWSNFDAILTEVLPVKGDNVRRVDAEGSAIGKSTLKSDGIKVGAATGTGAGIGAIAGGPVGAAVGAGVGAAIGVGAVVVEHGKHIKLNRSQQLRIKSSYETKIR